MNSIGAWSASHLWSHPRSRQATATNLVEKYAVFHLNRQFCSKEYDKERIYAVLGHVSTLCIQFNGPNSTGKKAKNQMATGTGKTAKIIPFFVVVECFKDQTSLCFFSFSFYFFQMTPIQQRCIFFFSVTGTKMHLFFFFFLWLEQRCILWIWFTKVRTSGIEIFFLARKRRFNKNHKADKPGTETTLQDSDNPTNRDNITRTAQLNITRSNYNLEPQTNSQKRPKPTKQQTNPSYINFKPIAGGA